MSKVREQRFHATRIQLRALPASDQSASIGTLTGYSSVFNVLSSDLGGFRERVAPHAFDKSLREGADVRATVNHDPSLVLGRVKNRTLKLSQDYVGLHVACDLPATSYGRDLLESVRRQDVSEMSFAFTALEEDWTREVDLDTGKMIDVRTLRSVNLLDCAFVTYPAYPGTSASVLDSAKALGRSLLLHTRRELFPVGVPAEVRMHVGRALDLSERSQRARQRLLDKVLGL